MGGPAKVAASGPPHCVHRKGAGFWYDPTTVTFRLFLYSFVFILFPFSFSVRDISLAYRLSLLMRTVSPLCQNHLLLLAVHELPLADVLPLRLRRPDLVLEPTLLSLLV